MKVAIIFTKKANNKYCISSLLMLKYTKIKIAMVGNMNQTKSEIKINFEKISLDDKPLYEKFFPDNEERGCEFSFANIYLWGRQNFAQTEGHIVLFSQFSRRSVYPYPVGIGDKRAVLDRIIADAGERGIPCRITGISKSARDTIEQLYPGRFRFHSDEGSFDYVYDINDLADLKGKKYQSKRNHINRFKESCPNYRAEPISESNIGLVKDMADRWYKEKLEENPNADYYMEEAALGKAFRYYKELCLEGVAIISDGEVLAFSFASRMTSDTFDVHFEKARSDIQGAYAIINCEFAKYIREKYPDVLFLDREEDMGIEGLKKAKLSYHPHHMVEKCWACLLEDGYEY